MSSVSINGSIYYGLFVNRQKLWAFHLSGQKCKNSVMWITILKSKSIISKSHQGSWETFTSEKSQEDQVDRHEERISEIAEGSWRGDRGQNEATETKDEKK